jgi:Camelysin metallo-endopeptidase
MRLLKSKKKIIALTAGMLVVGGGAYAYWTTTGTGSGSAATGTVVGITVNQTTTVAGLYPGGPAQTISGTFTNTNSGAVYVTAVTAALGTLPGGCLPADFTIAGGATVNANVPSGTGVGSWTGLTIVMNNTAVSQNACKASTIPLVLTSD